MITYFWSCSCEIGFREVDFKAVCSPGHKELIGESGQGNSLPVTSLLYSLRLNEIKVITLQLMGYDIIKIYLGR